MSKLLLLEEETSGASGSCLGGSEGYEVPAELSVLDSSTLLSVADLERELSRLFRADSSLLPSHTHNSHKLSGNFQTLYHLQT